MKLFCKHDYKPWANVHGDLINWMGGIRTVLYCKKCGKRKYIKDYIEAPLNYNAICNYISVLKYEGKELANELFGDDIFKDVNLYLELFGDRK